MFKLKKRIKQARKDLDNLESRLFQNAAQNNKPPVFLFVGGTPGSGKTTRLIPKLSTQIEQPFVLEIDMIKYYIPRELPGIVRNRLKNKYYKKFVERAIKEKLSIITTYPYIVFNMPKLYGFAQKALDNGYDIKNINFLYLESSYAQAYEGSEKKQTDTNKLLDEQFRFRPNLFNMSAFHLRNRMVLRKMQKDSEIFGKLRVFDRELNEK